MAELELLRRRIKILTRAVLLLLERAPDSPAVLELRALLQGQESADRARPPAVVIRRPGET